MPKVKNKLRVTGADLKNLRESGLSNETIRLNGLRTGDATLVFSYRNLEGGVNGFTRKRPHRPRVIDGKKVKYEQPKGSLLRAYFPIASLPTLRDATRACPKSM